MAKTAHHALLALSLRYAREKDDEKRREIEQEILAEAARTGREMLEGATTLLETRPVW